MPARTPMAPTAKLYLLRELYLHVRTEIETSEGVDNDRLNEVMADLAYLLGAVLTNSHCDWPSTRRVVEILKPRYPQGHPVWEYIREEGTDAA